MSAVTLDIETEIQRMVQSLGAEQKAQVLAYTRALQSDSVVGTPGSDLTRFAGLIPKRDMAEMMQAIQEDCERIDPNEW